MESNGVYYEWEKKCENGNYKFYYKLYNKSDSPKAVTIELPIKIRYGLHSWKGNYGEGSEWKQMSTKRKTKTININLSPSESYENTYRIRSPSKSYSVKSVSYTGDIKTKVDDFM